MYGGELTRKASSEAARRRRRSRTACKRPPGAGHQSGCQALRICFPVRMHSWSARWRRAVPTLVPRRGGATVHLLNDRIRTEASKRVHMGDRADGHAGPASTSPSRTNPFGESARSSLKASLPRGSGSGCPPSSESSALTRRRTAGASDDSASRIRMFWTLVERKKSGAIVSHLIHDRTLGLQHRCNTLSRTTGRLE